MKIGAPILRAIELLNLFLHDEMKYTMYATFHKTTDITDLINRM